MVSDMSKSSATVTDTFGVTGIDTTTLTIVANPAEIVGRHVFYNGSIFDGNDPGLDARDDLAIDQSKDALLPGQTATFANYTNYSRGINGIMVDIDNLPEGALLDITDFQFRVGNSNTPGTWSAVTAEPAVSIRRGAGTNGSDRVTIIWLDYDPDDPLNTAVAKNWLQVTVLATTNTGLAEPNIFYFGNAIGESGNSTTDAKVNAFDMLGARDNQWSFVDPAPIDFPFDYNRDQRVNVFDMLIARNSTTHFLNALKLITVPAGKGEIAADDLKSTAPAVQDVVMKQVPERESAKLAWLYEFDEPHESGEDQNDSARKTIDDVLAVE